jgi:branched-chain amino acid transport system substrate-binding protein
MTNVLKRKFGLPLLASCLLAGMSLGSPARADELRIGFLAPMTGLFAQIGKDMSDGFKMYLDHTKYDFGGAKVKLFIEDTEGKPATAALKAKKLITQNKVNMIIGGLPAPSGTALAAVSTREKTVYIASVPSADDLTQRKLNDYPYFIRTGWTSSQTTQPLGQWACEQGYKKIVTIAADYAFGYESVGGFQRVFESCGGKIIQKIWPPLGNQDFGPYIPKIRPDADALFTVMVGPMSLQFPKQIRASGFTKPIMGQGTSYDEFALPFMSEVAIGGVSALQYSAAIQTPRNEAFVKEYRSRYGKVPGYYSETNYTTALLIDAVMKKTHGKWPGGKQFIKIMQGLKVEAPRGPVSFDDMRNPVQNVYIKKVEKKKMFGYPKAELWNTVIKTYPNVSQFWTFGQKAFLKQPVYSRTFPPCKYCE